ncbi:MAG: exonuclease SbcCD subunit D C-terminal domain-containing protein [Micrococcales bacterium]|nr:exonuclease SbcCD subunit D C-terminal domain-containing protein [Micrococcales bacterium]
MRLLHTSDWHLGRMLHKVDLLEHQAAFADHLVQVVREQDVDVVVVAGDVYDRAIPPVEAVELLSDLLARLAGRTTVVITSGNHDSATRLGFGAAVMRDRVRVRTAVARVGEPVVVDDVAVYAVPYLDPTTARHQLVDDDGQMPERSHEAVLGAAMDRVRADLAQRGPVRSVVVAHACVVGAHLSDSERDIQVGGTDAVPGQVFAGVDYVALGHLHSPQQVVVPGPTVARYSGSPLAYSFAETEPKSSVLVELDAGAVRTSLVPTPVPRRMSQVTGRLADLLGADGEPFVDDWLKVRVTDPARPPDLVARLRRRFAHLLVVQHEPQADEQAASCSIRSAVPAADRPGADPLVVAGDFVAHVTGSGPSDAELAVLTCAYEDVLATAATV